MSALSLNHCMNVTIQTFMGLHPACNWMNIYPRQRSTYIMCCLLLSAVMLLYINQQLNVILYTYIFKRNSNQSLELNNLSARENDFQNIEPHMQTQGLRATKEQTLIHRDRACCCITTCEVKEPDDPIDNQKTITGQIVLTISIWTLLRLGLGLRNEVSVNSTGNPWQPQVKARIFTILEKWLTGFISCK